MPDRPNCRLPNDRASEFHDILLPRNHGSRGGKADMKKESRWNSKKLESSVSSGLHDRGHVYRTTASLRVQSPPKKARGKESSKHFGVRFRPDLHKWVAEIRVAEWKSVDKKVWLGTFDMEVGAARAVDVARKLLKCKKKKKFNFPCLSLDFFEEAIPSHLNLNDIENDAMFKEVTLFVKGKAQEYAASFYPSKLNDCASPITTHRLGPTNIYSWPTLAASHLHDHHNFSFHSQTSCVSLFEVNDLVSCQDSGALPTSCSNSEEFRWAHFDKLASGFDTPNQFHICAGLMIDEPIDECDALNAESANIFDFHDLQDYNLMLDHNALFGCDYHIPRDNHAYCTQELASMDNVVHDEMSYNNCWAYHDTPFQVTAPSTFLMSPLDHLLVH